MPVITVDPDELLRLTEADQFDLMEALPKLGVEIEKMEDEGWELEVDPDRLDMLSVEGLARSIRGFLDIETGKPEYQVKRSDIVTEVDLSVQEVRPYIVTAVVKDVQLNEKLLKSLMEIQEKLHLTLGRNRKKLAIGIHDFEPVEPPFTYEAVDPEDVSFLPLQSFREMDLEEILEKHEKGKEFSYILEDADRYPVIKDRDDNVLSFPPVINGQLTEVTSETNELFIDMTGTDEKVLDQALNIICALFYDRGGDIYTTKIRYGNREKIKPDLEEQEITINRDEIERLLGKELSDKEIITILARMRLNGEGSEEEEVKINVQIPPYRHDIIHPYDIIEDIAIGFDYDNFEGSMPEEVTVGEPLDSKKLEQTLSEIFVGYGFQEVMNYMLTNWEREAELLSPHSDEEPAKVKNPVTEEEEVVRMGLLVDLIQNLKENRNRSLPQKLFEIGDVVTPELDQRKMAGGVVMHSEAGFTETKSIIEGIMKNLGIDHELESKEHPSFIEGRCASLKYEGEEFGLFGEIHPEVNEKFGLEYPVTAFQLDLEMIMDIKDDKGL